MGNQEGKSLFNRSNFAKQTLVQQDEHVEFAVSHMKGKRWLMQAGDCIWRTPVSTSVIFRVKITISSESSMATEV